MIFCFLKCRLVGMIKKFKALDLHLLWEIFLKYKQNWYYPVVLDCPICHWKDKTLVNRFMKRKQNPITYWFLSPPTKEKKKEKSSHLCQLKSDLHSSNAVNMSPPDCLSPTSPTHHRTTWRPRNSQHISVHISGGHRGVLWSWGQALLRQPKKTQLGKKTRDLAILFSADPSYSRVYVWADYLLHEYHSL